MGGDSITIRQRNRPHDSVQGQYDLRGAGPQLTIVNNLFVSSPLWRSVTGRLVKRHRILTYERRTPAVADHAQELKDLLDTLGIDTTYLLGSSVATLVCRDFALAYPERVRGLILVGPVLCPFGAKRWKYLTRSWLSSLKAGGLEALFDHMYPLLYNDRAIENGGTTAYLALRERFLAQNDAEQMRRDLSALLASDGDPTRLRQVNCPTLLLAGDGDFLATPTALEATARLLPQARVKVIPFAGHLPYVEATTAFEESVQEFIAEGERHAA
jgi:pimeloyl-ACP methyl ester carboxylesterase